MRLPALHRLPRRLPRLPLRTLHSSPPRLAVEVQNDPSADPEIRALVDKVRGHKGTMEAMTRLREVMVKKGADLTRTPTKMEMLMFAADGEVRGALTNLIEQVKDAGVETNLAHMAQLFMKLKPPTP